MKCLQITPRLAGDRVTDDQPRFSCRGVVKGGVSKREGELRISGNEGFLVLRDPSFARSSGRGNLHPIAENVIDSSAHGAKSRFLLFRRAL
jgi:hypothetical protein